MFSIIPPHTLKKKKKHTIKTGRKDQEAMDVQGGVEEWRGHPQACGLVRNPNVLHKYCMLRGSAAWRLPFTRVIGTPFAGRPDAPYTLDLDSKWPKPAYVHAWRTNLDSRER